jgi:hypothetical protein
MQFNLFSKLFINKKVITIFLRHHCWCHKSTVDCHVGALEALSKLGRAKWRFEMRHQVWRNFSRALVCVEKHEITLNVASVME